MIVPTLEALLSLCLIVAVNTMLSPPTTDEYKKFFYILDIHKHLVYYLGALFNKADYSTHDDSKKSEPELTPYTLRFIRKLSKTENPNWKDAKNHHFATNIHHIEHWKYHAKQEMPEENLLEAIVDMMAAKFQYNLCTEVEDYVRIGQFGIDYKKLEGKLTEYLGKSEMYFFKDQYLSEYNDSQKSFINSKLQEYKKIFQSANHSEL